MLIKVGGRKSTQTSANIVLPVVLEVTLKVPNFPNFASKLILLAQRMLLLTGSL